MSSVSAGTAYRVSLLLGLGGLVAGATGPLLSNFVPLLIENALGDNRTAIGAVMAIDNVLLLLLVPWAGAVSDRASAHGGGRSPIVVAGRGPAHPPRRRRSRHGTDAGP